MIKITLQGVLVQIIPKVILTEPEQLNDLSFQRPSSPSPPPPWVGVRPVGFPPVGFLLDPPPLDPCLPVARKGKGRYF